MKGSAARCHAEINRFLIAADHCNGAADRELHNVNDPEYQGQANEIAQNLRLAATLCERESENWRARLRRVSR